MEIFILLVKIFTYIQKREFFVFEIYLCSLYVPGGPIFTLKTR